MESSNEIVVVPLTPTSGELDTESMLRMLLNRDAVMITRTKATRANAEDSGFLAQTAGAFARAMGTATQTFTHNGGNAEGLYKVILPSGATARDLVPAVGGGFRGIVRTAESTKIAGQARLIPVAGINTAATLAAGPLIATIALATASEMLAQHQINKKLDTIQRSVQAIHERMDEHDRAILDTANTQSKKVASYLLDQAEIPVFSSASHAFGELETLTTQYNNRLDRWTDNVKKYSKKSRVNSKELLTSLTKEKEGSIQTFETMLIRTYEALSLRAQVIVLEKIAAESLNKNRSLFKVEQVLHSELSDIAQRQQQLVELVDDLNALPLDSSKIPVVAFAMRKTIDMRTDLAKMAKALHQAPDALPVLNSSDQMVLDMEATTQGFSIKKPCEEAL